MNVSIEPGLARHLLHYLQNFSCQATGLEQSGASLAEQSQSSTCIETGRKEGDIGPDFLEHFNYLFYL